MQKTEDHAFQYQGSTMHLRVWEGETDQEKHTVVVEPGNGVPFQYNRVDLAEDISGQLGTTPDKLDWYEQAADGSMKQFQFEPYAIEHRPYANDMSRSDWEEAEKQGHLKPDTIQGFHPIDKPVTPEQKETIEAQVGEPIKSYEQRQEQDFAQLTYSNRNPNDIDH